jgi:serine protease Do
MRWAVVVVLGMWCAQARAAAPAGRLADLVETARQAVVHVRAVVPDTNHGSNTNAVLSVGSGFFVDRDGLIVTNEHVVRNAVDLRVRLHDGRELPACVVGTDGLTDIALLQVRPNRSVRALESGDSDRVRAGDTVVAIGSPFGFSHSATAGIVSACQRVLERSEMRSESDPQPAGGEGYSFFIQTDALINVGNSGGPLVNTRGQVIGVNSAFWGRAQGSAQGVGFAIPINIVTLLLPRLRHTGEAQRSYLGVQSQPLDMRLATALGSPVLSGALVAGVDANSPAEAAGLEPGDLVQSWNGKRLAGVEDFKIWAQLTPPRTRVSLTILRDGKASERVLTTAPAPQSEAGSMPPLYCKTLNESPLLPEGFEAEDLSVGRAKSLPGGKGVRIAKISGGAAVDAGLEVDDIVLRVGHQNVRDSAELTHALERHARDRPVPLLIRRDGADFWVGLPRR